MKRADTMAAAPSDEPSPTPPAASLWRAWGIDPSWSRTIDVPSWEGGTHRWHVLDRPAVADPAALTVVCVHGNPTWGVLWRSALARLDDRCRVVAVDQLGMGWSARTGPRTFADRVRDLGDVIDALEIDGPIVIAAHDWGGPISLGWVLQHRDRTAGIVLCNTGVAVPEGRRAPGVIRLAAAGPVTSVVGHRTRTFVEGTIALSRGRLPREISAALRAPYRRARDRAAIAAFVADIPLRPDHPSADAIARVAEGIRDLQVPTLLTWGARDPVFDDDFAHDLAARMPHADLHRVTGAGHLAPAETLAGDVAGAIDLWIRERVLAADRTAPGVGDRAATANSAGTAAVEHPPLWAALADRRDDDAIAVIDGRSGSTISFAELHRSVEAAAAGLAAAGLRRGDRVAVLVPPGIELVTAVYAVWRAGGVTVIADRGLGLRGLGAAVRTARPAWVVGPPRALAAARALRWSPRSRAIVVHPRRVLGAVATWRELVESTAEAPVPPSASDPAAVLYTSGATGPAKGVRYHHDQLAAQRDALRLLYAITPEDRLVAAFAPFALFGPALGIPSTIPDVDVTAPGSLTAEALGRACAAIGGTVVFGSPAALANVIRTAPSADERLSTVRLVLSAGAPVPIATLRSMAALCPTAELHTPYGMTECLPVADVDLVTLEGLTAPDGSTTERGVCVGLPADGADVLVAPLGFDASGVIEEAPSGATGELLVRAPWCSAGYDQLWRTERDARPRDASGLIWHRTGDVGHVDADGRLWIEGRTVHVIHAVDGPITPVPVEVAVQSVLDGSPSVANVAAVGVGPAGCQQLVVVVEDGSVSPGLADAPLTARVRAAATERTGWPVAAVLVSRALPVDIRHNTKIDRTAVAAWAARILAGGR